MELLSETKTQPTPSGLGIHGIARVGTEWFAANFSGGWNIYDSNFVQTGTTTPGLGETRALVLDASSGNLFVGGFHELSEGTIYEVTPSGTILNSFSSGAPSLNALAYDPSDDSLYAVHFNGSVQHFSTAGVPLNSFTIASDQWTGAAFDSVNKTLLLLTTNFDTVMEFTMLGAPVGTPLPFDAVSNNGQGLHYNSLTGVLHVTSQEGNVAAWRRAVPEPSTLILGIAGLASVGFATRRMTFRGRARMK